MSTRKVCGPFFFREDTVMATSYMKMLQTWLFPRLQEDESEDFVTQQDGAAPLHFRPDVRHWLNDILLHQWIGRSNNEDLMFCPWPARFPDLTPCDYFLWGYVKDKVFVPPQPVSIPDLKTRITVAVETITPDLLIRVGHELDYRLDVCRVMKGAHIEHLYACIINLWSYSFNSTSIYKSVTILVNIIYFQTAPIILIHAVLPHRHAVQSHTDW
jgi:hypothetical protein